MKIRTNAKRENSKRRNLKRLSAAVLFFFIVLPARGESIRALIAGINRVSLAEPEGITVPLSYVSSSLISLEGDIRFFRGIQIELTAPQNYLLYRDSLAIELYSDLNRVPEPGVADMEGRRLVFELLPAKIRTSYQIPLKAEHGLRTSPYATVLTGILEEPSFPLLFRLMPVIKGISDEMEGMSFSLHVKPILSGEGALRLRLRYPDNLPERPLTLLIDDEPVENPGEERLIKEGEHHLVVLSDDYRNKSSRFVIERAKILDLTVELLDTTPLLIFENPENARVYLNNVYIPDTRSPCPVEPGVHEVRFQVSDYTITRPITVIKGKTYRVALSVDVNVTESE